MTARSALGIWVDMTAPFDVVFFGDPRERRTLAAAGFRLLDAPVSSATPIMIVGGDHQMATDWIRKNDGFEHARTVILCARSDEDDADPLGWLRIVADALDTSFQLSWFEDVALPPRAGRNFDAVIATYIRASATDGG